MKWKIASLTCFSKMVGKFSFGRRRLSLYVVFPKRTVASNLARSRSANGNTMKRNNINYMFCYFFILFFFISLFSVAAFFISFSIHSFGKYRTKSHHNFQLSNGKCSAASNSKCIHFSENSNSSEDHVRSTEHQKPMQAIILPFIIYLYKCRL